MPMLPENHNYWIANPFEPLYRNLIEVERSFRMRRKLEQLVVVVVVDAAVAVVVVVECKRYSWATHFVSVYCGQNGVHGCYQNDLEIDLCFVTGGHWTDCWSYVDLVLVNVVGTYKYIWLAYFNCCHEQVLLPVIIVTIASSSSSISSKSWTLGSWKASSSSSVSWTTSSLSLSTSIKRRLSRWRRTFYRRWTFRFIHTRSCNVVHVYFLNRFPIFHDIFLSWCALTSFLCFPDVEKCE